jgi:hypothetical protein
MMEVFAKRRSLSLLLLLLIAQDARGFVARGGGGPRLFAAAPLSAAAPSCFLLDPASASPTLQELSSENLYRIISEVEECTDEQVNEMSE